MELQLEELDDLKMDKTLWTVWQKGYEAALKDALEIVHDKGHWERYDRIQRGIKELLGE